MFLLISIIYDNLSIEDMIIVTIIHFIIKTLT